VQKINQTINQFWVISQSLYAPPFSSWILFTRACYVNLWFLKCTNAGLLHYQSAIKLCVSAQSLTHTLLFLWRYKCFDKLMQIVMLFHQSFLCYYNKNAESRNQNPRPNVYYYNVMYNNDVLGKCEISWPSSDEWNFVHDGPTHSLRREWGRVQSPAKPNGGIFLVSKTDNPYFCLGAMK
jgi:hypothetical protein